nr:hypothetical protein [Tanacetum cinerariifolium]
MLLNRGGCEVASSMDILDCRGGVVMGAMVVWGHFGLLWCGGGGSGGVVAFWIVVVEEQGSSGGGSVGGSVVTSVVKRGW